MSIILLLAVLALAALALVVPTYGFHRRHSVSGRPEFIDQEKYFRWRCGGVQEVSGPYDDFTGVFKYEPTIVAHAEQHLASLAGYRSAHHAPYAVFDLDGTEAFADARVLYRFFTKKLCIPAEAILLFFSGRRGIHFYIDMGVVGAEPSASMHQYLKEFCRRIAGEAGVKIDMAVYGPLQIARSPNAKHAVSNFYKIYLEPTELYSCRWEEVLEMAQNPRYRELPPSTRGIMPELSKRWNECVAAVDRAAQRRNAVTTGGDALASATSANTTGHPYHSLPLISKESLDYIRFGDKLPEGERHARLVAAAANFADFGPGVKELAYALLYPPAFLSGLPDHEIRSAIEWAFKKNGRLTHG